MSPETVLILCLVCFAAGAGVMLATVNLWLDCADENLEQQDREDR